MRRGAILLVLTLGAVATAGDPTDLRNPKKSARARTLLKKGNAFWEAAQPTLGKLKEDQEVEPAQIEATLETVAEAVKSLELSLRLEWNQEANTALVDAAKAWYGLRGRLPPAPEPADEEAKEKAAKAASKARKARLRAVRAFLMEYGRLRRHTKMVRRCPRCDGHKIIRSAFGDAHDCPTCKKKGFQTDPEGILDAKWYVFSPLYRANSRKQQQMNRLLSVSRENAKRLGPFLNSIAIAGQPEDHEDWVRVRVKEKLYDEPGSKRLEKVEVTYTVFRIGEMWYLYERSFDRDLIEIPELRKDEK